MGLYNRHTLQHSKKVIVTVERTALTHLLPAQANWSKGIRGGGEQIFTHFATRSYGHEIAYALPLSEPMAMIRITDTNNYLLGEALEIGKRRTASEWVADLCPEFSSFTIQEIEKLPTTEAEVTTK